MIHCSADIFSGLSIFRSILLLILSGQVAPSAEFGLDFSFHVLLVGPSYLCSISIHFYANEFCHPYFFAAANVDLFIVAHFLFDL